MLFFHSTAILSFFYLDFSQKSSTFASVIELERHIEILLLSNDCVIVPDLGGFMAHHIEARYDEECQMFLPPLRTLGFNPQLKLNDSLLVQSYVEAYDISYPEALRRIETEVNELKQHLDNEGYYELNDLGCLSVNDEGRLEFEPCEAGILTPELYGLSTFEMIATGAAVVKAQKKPSVTDKALSDSDSDGERAITIKMSWVRNAVATAAALLAFFVLSQPVSNGGDSEGMSVSQVNLPIIHKQAAKSADVVIDAQMLKDTMEQQQLAEQQEETEPLVVEKQEAEQQEPVAEVEQPVVEKPVAEKKPVVEQPKKAVTKYLIVVASQVTQQGAEDFVNHLHRQGLSDAKIHIYNNIRRVICGSFSSDADAYKRLQQIHQYGELAEAWVLKVKE